MLRVGDGGEAVCGEAGETASSAGVAPFVEGWVTGDEEVSAAVCCEGVAEVVWLMCGDEMGSVAGLSCAAACGVSDENGMKGLSDAEVGLH